MLSLQIRTLAKNDIQEIYALVGVVTDKMKEADL